MLVGGSMLREYCLIASKVLAKVTPICLNLYSNRVRPDEPTHQASAQPPLPENCQFIRHAATFQYWQGFPRCGRVAEAPTLRMPPRMPVPTSSRRKCDELSATPQALPLQGFSETLRRGGTFQNFPPPNPSPPSL